MHAPVTRRPRAGFAVLRKTKLLRLGLVAGFVASKRVCSREQLRLRLAMLLCYKSANRRMQPVARHFYYVQRDFPEGPSVWDHIYEHRNERPTAFIRFTSHTPAMFAMIVDKVRELYPELEAGERSATRRARSTRPSPAVPTQVPTTLPRHRRRSGPAPRLQHRDHHRHLPALPVQQRAPHAPRVRLQAPAVEHQRQSRPRAPPRYVGDGGAGPARALPVAGGGGEDKQGAHAGTGATAAAEAAAAAAAAAWNAPTMVPACSFLCSGSMAVYRVARLSCAADTVACRRAARSAAPSAAASPESTADGPAVATAADVMRLRSASSIAETALPAAGAGLYLAEKAAGALVSALAAAARGLPCFWPLSVASSASAAVHAASMSRARFGVSASTWREGRETRTLRKRTAPHPQTQATACAAIGASLTLRGGVAHLDP